MERGRGQCAAAAAALFEGSRRRLPRRPLMEASHNAKGIGAGGEGEGRGGGRTE